MQNGRGEIRTLPECDKLVEAILPILHRIPNVQDLYGLFSLSVNKQVRRPGDYPLSRALPKAGTADMRMFLQSPRCVENTTSERVCRIRI